MNVEVITQNGRERVVMDRSVYEDLVDARDHAIAMRSIAGGAPTFTSAELDDYLASPTPLAYWRKRANRSREALADQAGVPRAVLTQIEEGECQCELAVLTRIARALGVSLDDLVAD